MIITKKNYDNSSVFTKHLPQEDYILLIIIKKLNYLPNFQYDNHVCIFITEQDDINNEPIDITDYFPNAKIFLKNDLNKFLTTHLEVSNFSENIFKNLYRHTETTINEAAKYASIAYINNKDSNMRNYLVITATEEYPDAMILLEPATPEFQEKTHIKKIICYPNMI